VLAGGSQLAMRLSTVFIKDKTAENYLAVAAATAPTQPVYCGAGAQIINHAAVTTKSAASHQSVRAAQIIIIVPVIVPTNHKSTSKLTV
jgi:hypothetical protein